MKLAKQAVYISAAPIATGHAHARSPDIRLNTFPQTTAHRLKKRKWSLLILVSTTGSPRSTAISAKRRENVSVDQYCLVWAVVAAAKGAACSGHN